MTPADHATLADHLCRGHVSAYADAVQHLAAAILELDARTSAPPAPTPEIGTHYVYQGSDEEARELNELHAKLAAANQRAEKQHHLLDDIAGALLGIPPDQRGTYSAPQLPAIAGKLVREKAEAESALAAMEPRIDELTREKVAAVANLDKWQALADRQRRVVEAAKALRELDRGLVAWWDRKAELWAAVDALSAPPAATPEATATGAEDEAGAIDVEGRLDEFGVQLFRVGMGNAGAALQMASLGVATLIEFSTPATEAATGAACPFEFPVMPATCVEPAGHEGPHRRVLGDPAGFHFEMTAIEEDDRCAECGGVGGSDEVDAPRHAHDCAACVSCGKPKSNGLCDECGKVIDEQAKAEEDALYARLAASESREREAVERLKATELEVSRLRTTLANAVNALPGYGCSGVLLTPDSPIDDLMMAARDVRGLRRLHDEAEAKRKAAMETLTEAEKDRDAWKARATSAEEREREAPPINRNAVVEKLLCALHLYPHYNLRDRGPLGLIYDVLEMARPDVVERLRGGDETWGDVYREFDPYIPPADVAGAGGADGEGE